MKTTAEISHLLSTTCLAKEERSCAQWREASTKWIIPPLANSRHKGQYGKVLVVGGSQEFAGAPYYAAMAALKTGLDLVYILTIPDAAAVIKTFSPELIVYPLLHKLSEVADAEDSSNESTEKLVRSLLSKVDSVVIGPGLGDTDTSSGSHDPHGARRRCEAFRKIVIMAIEYDKFIVLDADGIRVLCNNPDLYSLVYGYQKCILTPNMYEVQLLSRSLMGSPPREPHCEINENFHFNPTDTLPTSLYSYARHFAYLADRLSGPTIIVKGACDIVMTPSFSSQADFSLRAMRENDHSNPSAKFDDREINVGCCFRKGTPKRSGGQGDILAGAVSAFVSWLSVSPEFLDVRTVQKSEDSGLMAQVNIRKKDAAGILCAVVCACELVREAARMAFEKVGRGMTSPDILENIAESFRILFDHDIGNLA